MSEAKESKKENAKNQKLVMFPVNEDSISKDFAKFLKSVSGDEKGCSKDQISETKHSITLKGKKINYTARAAYLPLYKKDGSLRCHIFYVAYTADDKNKKRPITFCFNGGPGSSSVWLHMGAFGPKRVQLSSEDGHEAAPGKLVDNEFSLLDQSDLVFIDPISTGLSRANTEDEAKEFHNVKGDVESVGDFIYHFTNEFSRWQSAKYIAGESYGTTRACGLASYLQDRYGLYANGLLLVSVAMNFQTLEFDASNDLPYPLILPTYAASAWYHKRLSARLQKMSLKNFLKEVETYARDDYARALFYGDRLPKSEWQSVVQKLSEYTGLKKEVLQKLNLRPTVADFQRHLLGDTGHWVGRLDTRFQGEVIVHREVYEKARQGWMDPSYYAIYGAYTAMFHHYLKDELKFHSKEAYEVLASLYTTWDWSAAKNSYVTLSTDLCKAMIMNPHLKVFVANGYYDLATPHLASEYTFDHLGVSEALKKNISMYYYEAGHMMYIHAASHKQLKADLQVFYGVAR